MDMIQPIMGVVISYTRFSNEKQRDGNSIERQSGYAARYAAAHGMVLDESLSMSDEGLSAYSQKHIVKGKLGIFLRAVEDGRVPPGSVLIVEDLDRLSRAEPMAALGQLSTLVSAGITVVTVIDEKTYSRESLKENPWDLMYSLLKMVRAHEESDTKSKRVKDSIESRCQKWVEGVSRLPIRQGRDPAWVRWVDGSWEIVPEEAARVRRIVELYMAGYGADRITKVLQAEGFILPDISQSGNLYRFFTSKHHLLIGTKVIMNKGNEYRLEGYYPPLIDMDTYHQLVASGRTRKRGAECKVPGIMNGGLLRCGYCGGFMSMQLMNGKKSLDKITDGERRMRCDTVGCRSASIAGVPVEKALVAWCSDQMNLNSLVGIDESQRLRANIADGKNSINDYDRQLARLANAVATSDDPPAELTKKMRSIEMLRTNLVHQLHVLESRLATTMNMPTQEAAVAWRELEQAAIRDLDFDARIRLRKLVSDTFSKITVYRHGTDPGPRRPRRHEAAIPYELVLVGKSGVTRQIKFNREGVLLEAKEEKRPAKAA